MTNHLGIGIEDKDLYIALSNQSKVGIIIDAVRKRNQFFICFTSHEGEVNELAVKRGDISICVRDFFTGDINDRFVDFLKLIFLSDVVKHGEEIWFLWSCCSQNKIKILFQPTKSRVKGYPTVHRSSESCNYYDCEGIGVAADSTSSHLRDRTVGATDHF